MIRKFCIDDLDSVMKLWLETNISAHDFIDKNYWMSNYEDVRKMIPEAEIFLYEENKIIKGFIGLMDSFIAGIFVQKDSQSKGIGKSMIDYTKSIKDELMLHVYEKNSNAVKFYLREDFQIVKEQIDENTGESELLMKWSRESWFKDKE